MKNLLEHIKAASNSESEFDQPKQSLTIDGLKEKLGQPGLPEEYLQLLTETTGMDISGPEESLHFLSVKDLLQINDDPSYKSDLPYLFFFGDNRGGKFYAFDPGNEWGHGSNAIYMVPMSMLDKKFSRYLGNDLFDIITKIDQGDYFLNYPALG